MAKSIFQELRELHKGTKVNPAYKEWVKRFKPASQKLFLAQRAVSSHVFKSYSEPDPDYEAKLRAVRDAEDELALVKREKPVVRIPIERKKRAR